MRAVSIAARVLHAALPIDKDQCSWRMGVPTYDDDKPWNRPGAETLDAALDGVIAAPVHARGPRGLAVHASWTTDSAEWSTFDLRWGHAAPLDVSVIDPP